MMRPTNESSPASSTSFYGYDLVTLASGWQGQGFVENQTHRTSDSAKIKLFGHQTHQTLTSSNSKFSKNQTHQIHWQSNSSKIKLIKHQTKQTSKSLIIKPIKKHIDLKWTSLNIKHQTHQILNSSKSN